MYYINDVEELNELLEEYNLSGAVLYDCTDKNKVYTRVQWEEVLNETNVGVRTIDRWGPDPYKEDFLRNKPLYIFPVLDIVLYKEEKEYIPRVDEQGNIIMTKHPDNEHVVVPEIDTIVNIIYDSVYVDDLEVLKKSNLLNIIKKI
jgi:hypothetical protein